MMIGPALQVISPVYLAHSLKIYAPFMVAVVSAVWRSINSF